MTKEFPLCPKCKTGLICKNDQIVNEDQDERDIYFLECPSCGYRFYQSEIEDNAE